MKSNANVQQAKLNKPIIVEDWAVVVLGFLIISVVLLGYIVPTPSFGWKNSSELFSKVLSTANLYKIFIQFFSLLVVAVFGAWLTKRPIKNFVIVFASVYLLTLAALIITGNASVKTLNLEAVLFSLLIGLLIGNTVKLPTWYRSALTSEFFVKIGLVLLGTTIIFSDVLKAGALGLIQALLVVVSVWYFSFWVCKKLKVDSEMSMMLSSAVSICGVSAAIATAGAIKGDNKKLSYVVSLVLIVAIPMMIFMPMIAKYFGFGETLTGAWLGGTIDTTGAVVASGTMVGEEALKISTIVKFSQNVLLGLAAFAISIYWTYANKGNIVTEDHKPTLQIIWQRFPKFVLGFVAASLLFSFVISPEKVSAVKDSIKGIQTLWFALAFTSIGLETKFSDLLHQDNRKPLYAFLIAQTFNIFITLFIAWLLFR